MSHLKTLYTTEFVSPIGTLLIAVDEAGQLVRLLFPNELAAWADEATARRYAPVPAAERCAHVITQLDEYFRGVRRDFDLPLNPDGTPFQQQVWAALQTIPYGVTLSYKALAERIGNPAAVRAVGRANGTNRIPIIIPCHRVIGADGSLTGFGGGLPLKQKLLQLEGVKVLAADAPAEMQLALL
jgi:methylated-DNA-[protein]-cysteine S-methyltransferase